MGKQNVLAAEASKLTPCRQNVSTKIMRYIVNYYRFQIQTKNKEMFNVC